MTDRERIESVIQRLRAGEISPQQATQQLLSAEQTETLASLLQRLGTPPVDIIDHWSAQMRAIASGYEQDQMQPLPEIDLEQWSMNSRGELLFHGRNYAVSGDPPRLSQTSRDRIEAFADQWTAGPLIRTVVPGGGAAAEPAVLPQSKPLAPRRSSSPARPSAAPQTAGPGWSPATIKLGIAALLAVLLVAGVVTYRLSQPATREVAGNPSEQPGADGEAELGGVFSSPSSITLEAVGPDSLIGQATAGGDEQMPLLAQPAPADAESANESSPETRAPIPTDGLVNLQTFESLSKTRTNERPPDLSISFGEQTSGSFDVLQSLESTARISSSNPADAPASDGEPGNPSSPPPPEADGAIDPAGDEVASAESPPVPQKSAIEQLDVDQPPPRESPQPTRRAAVTAVDLGNPDDTKEPLTLSDQPLRQPRLEFAVEVPVELTPMADPSAWLVRDTAKNIELATIASTSGPTSWQWQPAASKSSAAKSLAHGRLVTEQTTIYLRPQIEADPWVFNFAERDVMPSWDLGYPLPPQAGRIEVEFKLPTGIEYVWLEPLQATEPRRTRGLAEIKLEGDEEIALGVLLNIQCNRKLSVRLRFGARLAPQANWSMVSQPLLDQFARRTAIQKAMLESEQQRFAKLYRERSRADERKLIRAQQEKIEATTEAVSGVIERTKKLQSLLATLQAEGAIHMRLWVPWPDHDQEILVAGEFTASPADHGASKVTP